ncbi:MAG: zinc metallopeptidase [Thermoguttaceae bacterium]
MIFDPMYFLFVIPPLLLALWAQAMVKWNYAAASQQPAPLSGAAAARHILDSAGLTNVPIEMVPGQLTDHYDPGPKVVRLSEDVYNGRTLAAVGIAAHEVGHAMQDAKSYAPLVLRNIAVPAASFGSNFAFILLFAGAFLNIMGLVLVGVIGFGAVALFQIINLPVEFNASSRAKQQLASLGIVSDEQMVYVRRVLSAAALTYVAAMLMALMQFLYYAWRFLGSRD